MKNVCIVTGSRADYGLLFGLLRSIKKEPDFKLQVIATGMHLSSEFGKTYRQIERDGFKINSKVEMLLSSDSPVGIAKSIGLGIISFADAFSKLNPDIIVLLGDRYEILSSAIAALPAKIPIAHIAGGDTTEGAFDESIRHSITKIAHIHFVTNEQARRRIVQMGENPRNVHLVGSPGIDRILEVPVISRKTLESKLKFKFKNKNLLITFHPATLDSQLPSEQFAEILTALDKFGPETGLIFTKPNSDTNGRPLIKMIDAFVVKHSNSKAFVSLGSELYINVLHQVDAIIGNSSSGLYEMPTFQKPTVNIGNRQKGRLQAKSVINCSVSSAAIYTAINRALRFNTAGVINPYGKGNSTSRILALLKMYMNKGILVKKHFYDSK